MPVANLLPMALFSIEVGSQVTPSIHCNIALLIK